MTIYDFLEKMYRSGGDLKAVKLVPEEPLMRVGIFSQTVKLLDEFNSRDPEGQQRGEGVRQFGFHRTSRIGELEVSSLQRLRKLSGEIVQVGITASLVDQRIIARQRSRQPH